MITPDQIAQQKDRLPRGWGRFGKAIDYLAEIGESDEELLAACVTLNPTFQHRKVTLVGGLLELTKSTNVVLAVTDKRLLVVATGAGGAQRTHYAIAFDGLEIVDHSKKEITLRWADGEARFSGAAKTQLPELVTALTERLR
jgi:Bacterial PH domain